MLCFSDGKNLLPLPSSRDHKRIGDGDTGPNTGGMGAIAPVAEIDAVLQERILNSIFKPVIEEMNRLGTPFKGILYGGLMLTDNGPYVIEFNARFGDPEAQAVLPLVKNDLYALFKATVAGELDKHQPEYSGDFSCVVMMASRGYPGKYRTGYAISGLDKVRDAFVYHSGTVKINGGFATSGGRVLGVSAQADSMDSAIAKAYAELVKISFNNNVYRRDIGKNLR